MVMRLAATARKATPPLFETLSVLGRDMTRRRLRLCADFLKKAKPCDYRARIKSPNGFDVVENS
jgi:hypothetical protein